MAAEMSEELMPIVRGSLIPTSWAVVCPLCGGAIEVEHVREDDAGVFHADKIDTAPDCPTCRVCVETLGVSVVEIVDNEQAANE